MYTIEGTYEELKKCKVDLFKFHEEQEMMFIIKDGKRYKKVHFIVKDYFNVEQVTYRNKYKELKSKLNFYDFRIMEKIKEYYNTNVYILYCGKEDDDLYYYFFLIFKKDTDEDLVNRIATAIKNLYNFEDSFAFRIERVDTKDMNDIFPATEIKDDEKVYLCLLER